MKWHVKVLPEARRDYLNTIYFLSGFYPSTPVNFQNAYRRIIRQLEDNPYSWSEYYDYPIYRRAIAGKYTIFYIVDDDAREVQIHRMLRGSSNILRILQNDKNKHTAGRRPHMPLIISHRGANKLAPENTLAAFKKALEFRVDGFENDVHMTADGQLVVCHDDTVDRTSNGTGMIHEMTFEQLRALDFGGWFAPEFAGEKIPTLAEFFALCGPLKVVNVEIKRAPDGGTASAPAVVRLAKEMGVFDKLIVSSFDMDMLQACLAEDAATRVCFLYSPGTACCEALHGDPAAFAKQYGLYAYHPFVMLVSQDFIAECHEAGIVVNAWTVNQDHAIELLRDWDADGIITDEPALAMGIIYAGS